MTTDVKVAFTARQAELLAVLDVLPNQPKVKKLLSKTGALDAPGRLLLSNNTAADFLEPSLNTSFPEVILHYKAKKSMTKVVEVECMGLTVTLAPRVFDDTYGVSVMDGIYTHPEAARLLQSFLP